MKSRRLLFKHACVAPGPGASDSRRVVLPLLLGAVLASSAFPVSAQRPLGTDVSSHQPNVNWTSVKNGGVAFAWAKATEGTGYTNPDFASQEAGATSVGIYIGAYHFARPGSNPSITGVNSADSEAAYFWSVASNYVKLGGQYLVPMLDWEDTTMSNQLSAATLSAWVNEWCASVSNYARIDGAPGVRPVVYTGTWYSRPGSTYSGLTTAVTGWPSWIAAYPTSPNPQTGGPSDTYPWANWNIWQYADTNWSGGDADVYQGTLANFIQTFVVGGTNAPSFVASPANVTVSAGSRATFAVRVGGVPPISFRWLFEGAAISGATSSNYTISSAQLNSAGAYTVVVSNSYATVSSTPFYLTVLTNLPGSVLAPSGLVDWWPADATPIDIFGGNNATPYNGVTYVVGKEDLAFHFDGSSGYLVTGAASLPTPWTACMWVNRQNAPGTGAALMGDGTYELKLEQYNGTHQVGVTQFGVGDYSFGYIVPVGTWTHLAFVGTSGGTALYVNGVLQSTLTNTLPLPRAYIGAGYVASGSRFVDYMLGALDEVVLFNRALSASEISAIYAAGSAGMVRAPEFTAVQAIGVGQVRLSLRGQTGKSFSIDTSPDLNTWTRLTTLANPTGATQYTDTTGVQAQGFFRASQP